MNVAVCAVASGGEPLQLLESAITGAGIWERLAATGKGPAATRVLVLPELLCFAAGDAHGTDAALVEGLIDLLGERDYADVAVGVTAGPEDAWLDGRDLGHLLQVAGYRGVTASGRAYRFTDLARDLVPVAFPPASALRGTSLARGWVEADFRISFAKCRTHEEHGYALCLHNLLGTLPLKDKLYHYRGRLKPWDVCVDLLRWTPPHFNVIDAVVSNHGSWPSRAPRPLRTGTVIASPDTLLADWAGALKMGVDPYQSPLNAQALAQIGLPEAYDITGEMVPFRGWEQAHPLAIAGARRINESASVQHALAPLTTRVDRREFRFRNAAVGRLNRVLAPLASESGAASVWLQAWLAAAVEGVMAWRTLFAKEQLRRRDVSLDLDLDAFEPADYEAVDDYIEPLEQLIRTVPADHSGLRWRYLDGSVLFEFSRVVDIPFEAFAERVDVSRAISYMQDYIGGRAVPVSSDARGRVTHQAERNLYLPQPNYIVLYGGKVIDVTKLEHVRYGDGEQTIRWRTLASANGSAEHDDGSVRFADAGPGYTEITVVGRQKFVLPPFWQLFDLDLFPELKDALVGDAYFSFFDGTMTNFQAAYEGRDVRAGRPWDDTDGAPLTLDAPAAVARAAELVRELGALWSTRAREPVPTDADGFRRFPAPQQGGTRAAGGAPIRALKELTAFVDGLNNAVARDLGVASDEE